LFSREEEEEEEEGTVIAYQRCESPSRIPSKLLKPTFSLRILCNSLHPSLSAIIFTNGFDFDFVFVCGIELFRF